MTNRPYLYIIATVYPYGPGEVFLENELFVLSEYYSKIYIVIPEAHKLDQSVMRYRVPANAEIIKLSVRAGFAGKFFALFRWPTRSWSMERNQIRKAYRQKYRALHFRIMLGFQAMADAFRNSFTALLKANGHKPEEIVVYTYWFTYATLGIADLKSKIPGLHAVSRVHGWDCFYNLHPGKYLPMRPWVCSTLDHILSVSESGVRHLREKLPNLPAEKIEKSYLGIADVPFVPRSKNKERLHILSIAVVVPVKRLHLIARALRLVNTDVIWTHAGCKPNEKGVGEEIKSLLAGNPRVQFNEAGMLNPKEVFRLLREDGADLLISVSASEGIPVSMMEAMAHGIPVLATAVGGVPEIVKHKQTGILLSPNPELSEIASAIDDFARLSDEEYYEMSKRAYRMYSESFNANKNYRNFQAQFLVK